jgi:hypothetical protein
MRKTIGREAVQVSVPDRIDVEADAHVSLTSEDAAHPIENAFDAYSAPGGTEWVASGPGDQTITVSFDSPRAVRAVVLEIEETSASRVQEVELAVADGAGPLAVVLRQEFHFSPAGATIERERWALDRGDVRQVRLVIRPDKGGGSARARITTLAFER